MQNRQGKAPARPLFKRGYGGFTILELMITVGIVGIITATAVPSLRVMASNNKMVAQYNYFMGILQFARSEAVANNTWVTVCGSDDITQVPPTCDAGAKWHNGWVAFHDFDGNKIIDTGGGTDLLIRVGEPIEIMTLAKNSHAGSDNFSLQFDRNGRPSGDDDGAYSFTLCDSRGPTSAKGINVNLTGRINRATDGNDNDTIEDETGAEVTVCEP